MSVHPVRHVGRSRRRSHAVRGHRRGGRKFFLSEEPIVPGERGPGLPGAFADSAPDRWGRNLIDERRRALQRETAERLPALTEVDDLTEASDLSRQGSSRPVDVGGRNLLLLSRVRPRSTGHAHRARQRDDDARGDRRGRSALPSTSTRIQTSGTAGSPV